MSSLPHPTLYAHRGAAAECPENTVQAFRRALDLGADAIETDVHVTADGHAVLAHDPDGARTAGVARAIRELTLAEVQRWNVGARFVAADGSRPFRDVGCVVPTLAHALRELPGVRFNVDIKPGVAAVGPVLDAVRGAGAPDRVLLTSFSSAALREVRRRSYEGPTGLGQSEALRLLTASTASLRARPLGGSAAQLPVKLGPIPIATRRTIARAHALGLRVDFWTINRVDVARALLAMGADGIVSDDPRTLAPLFAELRRR